MDPRVVACQGRWVPARCDRAAASLLLTLLLTLLLGGCVEIDPSYADSYTSGASGEATGADTQTADSDTGEGSGSSGDPTCDCGPWELCEAGACTAPARILFINLDGATTVFGAADASMDSQNLFPEFAGTWSGYSDDEVARQALMDAITIQWAPFRVVVTDQRPDASAAPYAMAIVTADPRPAGFEGTPWVAFPDCGDSIPRDVTFVFAAPGDGFSTQQHANTTSQALGRTFGLQRTNSPDDINGSGGQFLDQCIARAEDPPCAAHDPGLCGGDATQQNAYRELESLVGLRP